MSAAALVQPDGGRTVGLTADLSSRRGRMKVMMTESKSGVTMCAVSPHPNGREVPQPRRACGNYLVSGSDVLRAPLNSSERISERSYVRAGESVIRIRAVPPRPRQAPTAARRRARRAHPEGVRHAPRARTPERED